MNSRFFLKRMYWSALTGKHVNKENGAQVSEPIMPKMPPRGQINKWEDGLVYLILDASNQSQEANGAATIVVNTFNRETKLTTYSESFPIVANSRFGLLAWDIIKRVTDFKIDYSSPEEFRGSLFGMTIEFDPVLQDNLVVVGEIGKNPILIEILDLLEN